MADHRPRLRPDLERPLRLARAARRGCLDGGIGAEAAGLRTALAEVAGFALPLAALGAFTPVRRPEAT